jgi:hypothetical protein
MKRKSRGQPKSDGTIRILKDGTARLAANLAEVAELLTVRFDGSKIILHRNKFENSKDFVTLMTYASNGGAASPLISLMGTLTAMGFPREVQENLAGEYKVKVVNGMIEFDLNCEIKK